MQETDKQPKSNGRGDVTPLRPHQWKKGQSGNIMGRPKGKTMKEYAKEYLSKMTEEERDEWLEGIDKIEIFKMAEGNPQSNADLNLKGDLVIQISEAIAKKNDTNPIPKQNSGESQ